MMTRKANLNRAGLIVGAMAIVFMTIESAFGH